MDRCIGGRGEFEKFYFPVKSDHFLPYSRYSALARGLVKEAPWGVGVGEIFHFPAKPGHFLPHLPLSALARGLVREAPLGCQGWRDFPFSCQTRSFPATSSAFCIGERVGSGGASGDFRAGEIFHFPAKPGHFLPHPASAGRFRRFRVETVGVRVQQQLC